MWNQKVKFILIRLLLTWAPMVQAGPTSGKADVTIALLTQQGSKLKESHNCGLVRASSYSWRARYERVCGEQMKRCGWGVMSGWTIDLRKSDWSDFPGSDLANKALMMSPMIAIWDRLGERQENLDLLKFYLVICPNQEDWLKARYLTVVWSSLS